jgi:hypothetical protein
MNTTKQKETRKIFGIRLTDTEKLKITEYAAEHELTIADYIRTIALRKKATKRLPSITKATYVELCRQGVNLNQLTREYNTLVASGEVYQLSTKDRDLIKKNYQLLNKILKILA